MVHHSSRLNRRAAKLAVRGLMNIVSDPTATSAARVAAARALLAHGGGECADDGGRAAAPVQIEKLVRIDWGDGSS
jgi:hypothetical protein